MNSEQLLIHPAALEEAEAAIEWYARRSQRAARMFLDELEGAIDRIGQNPKQYPLHDFDTRRLVCAGFLSL